MKALQKLYREFGFNEIDQYVFNPVDGAVFMEKSLDMTRFPSIRIPMFQSIIGKWEFL